VAVLGLAASLAHAAPLQSEYLDIYLKMNEAQKLEETGDDRNALAGFEDCYTRLARIHQDNPNWESALVKSRLNDCRASITTLEAKLAPPASKPAPVTAAPTSPVAAPESTKARLAELEQAAKAAPNDANATFNLGVAYYQVDQTDEAIATLQRGLTLAPGNAFAHNFLGCALLRDGHITAASKEFLKAIAVDEGFAEAHYNLAILYATEDPPAMNSARTQYKRAMDLGIVPDPHLQKVLRASNHGAETPSKSVP
jgi:tetratricopeptide (TPR) repeat protein